MNTYAKMIGILIASIMFIGTTLCVQAEPMQDYLVVTGTIAADGTIILDESRVISLPVGTSDDAGTGSYSLELLDAGGASLFKRNFDPTLLSGNSDEVVFFQVVPYQENTAQIILANNSQVIETIVVSANTPVVTVISPNGGEGLNNIQTISWSAADADGDSMVYDIQLSIDGGLTWVALASDLTTTSYDWDTGMSPGTNQGLIRVSATDGVNTGQDESDGVFTIPNRRPEPIIIAPEAGATFLTGQSILFKGAAYDNEDGMLGDNSLSWELSPGISLGTGRELIVQDLPLGQNYIIVVAVDSGGARTKSNTLTITVVDEADSDGDTYFDSVDNCPFVSNTDQADDNGNNIGDACDDFDNDGFVDSIDNCLRVPNDQTNSDLDMIGDICDNCLLHENQDQLDTDGDGYGNLCDGDLNNDGGTNTLDLNLYKQAHRTSVGDANYDVDADFNGDGTINTLDLNIYKGLHRKPPGPSCCAP